MFGNRYRSLDPIGTPVQFNSECLTLTHMSMDFDSFKYIKMLMDEAIFLI